MERLMYVATILTDTSFHTKFQVATLNKSSVSTWYMYKCLNLSLTRSCTYVRTCIHSERCNRKKNYMPPASCPWRGHKKNTLPKLNPSSPAGLLLLIVTSPQPKFRIQNSLLFSAEHLISQVLQQCNWF